MSCKLFRDDEYLRYEYYHLFYNTLLSLYSATARSLRTNLCSTLTPTCLRRNTRRRGARRIKKSRRVSLVETLPRARPRFAPNRNRRRVRAKGGIRNARTRFPVFWGCARQCARWWRFGEGAAERSVFDVFVFVVVFFSAEERFEIFCEAGKVRAAVEDGELFFRSCCRRFRVVVVVVV